MKWAARAVSALPAGMKVWPRLSAPAISYLRVPVRPLRFGGHFFLSMHLVFLNQYYPLDAAPTGVMLEAVVRQLAEEGHEVTVLCASGGYARAESKIESPDSRVPTEREIHSASSSQPSNINHPLIHIVRIPATQFGRGSAIYKLIDYASFYLMVAWKLATLRPDPDRVVALTTPPFLSVLARLISKFLGADHALWVMDLYPDVMVAHGMLPDGGWKHRVLACIARWGFSGKRCATVLTLGPDMAERVSRVMGSGVSATVQWVPLWGAEVIRDQSSVISGERGGTSNIEGRQETERGIHSASSSEPSTINHQPSTLNDQLSSALRAQRGWLADELVVMYSGNMGLGHRFGEFLEAAKVHGQSISHTRFVFYGGGKRRLEIEDFISQYPDCPIELHDYAPAQDLSAHLQSADVHLASLDAAWSGTMVPSKLQGIFAVGRPVIFVGSSQSSIGRWVAESGGGWLVEPGDVSGLLVALNEAGDPGVRTARGNAAAEFAKSHFDKNTNATRVADILTR